MQLSQHALTIPAAPNDTETIKHLPFLILTMTNYARFLFPFFTLLVME